MNYDEYSDCDSCGEATHMDYLVEPGSKYFQAEPGEIFDQVAFDKAKCEVVCEKCYLKYVRLEGEIC